jgi:hypothetical protein
MLRVSNILAILLTTLVSLEALPVPLSQRTVFGHDGRGDPCDGKSYCSFRLDRINRELSD